MHRRSGLTTLLVGVIVFFPLVFAPFDEPVRRWTVSDQGDLERAQVVCPDAWSALVEVERLDTNFRIEADQCVRGARTHASVAVIVLVAALVLGVNGMMRGPAPPRTPLRPLSEVIARHANSSGKRNG